jgi:two-component system CheB/CheR fusion protein
MAHENSPATEATAQPGNGAVFPIVGVGASAGGLEALQQLLRALPVNTGMGFVIVQHLAPDHASSLAEILSRATKMPVSEVRDEPQVEPDHVYVIPPGRDIIIAGGKLRLLPQERHTRHRGIDQFFRSLAEDSRHQAIGVVLSGSASDGTLGLEVIKAEGGVTFAQDESALHDSMPKSAVASGCVDFVLPPEGVAQEIARIAQHPYVAGATGKKAGEENDPDHGRIAEIVRRATGVDFTHYKASTMQRRIQRRMMVHKIATPAEYEKLLRATPREIEALYQDVLISVTSFFRNRAAFEALATKVFPKLLVDRTAHDPVRMWTLGCSTGEEAYSLAMLFAECVEAAKSSARLQLFASDINATSIEKARVGRYPLSIAQDVSPERLRKFFVKEDGHYRVSKSIRECIVFSRHNVLADPPFSRVDFISCRNLLIYLEPVLQEQVMPLLHYALKPGGHLWLGSAESPGTSRELFEVADARQKIFIRRPGPTPAGPHFRGGQSTAVFPVTTPGRETPQTMLHRDAERVLLAKYAPPGVVVNARLEVVQFRGETGPYLAPAAGIPSHDLLKMLREGLLLPVRAALARAESEGSAVREEGARVKSDNGHRELAIEVIPLHAGPGREAGFVALFDEGTTPPAEKRSEAKQNTESSQKNKKAVRLKQTRQPQSASDNEKDEIARLTRELAATRAYLQSVIEQQDAANEELQSANEEAQSTNEEMQSVNEELQTSKEEIESSSEELATVNEELNNRNAELNGLNNDLNNVLASTRLSIVIVTRDLRIRRFTPVAEKTLQLAASDLGRPLGEIKLSIAMPELAPLLHEVIDSISPRERDVQDAEGRWFSLRARPYLTHENKIDGAVVTLVDVDTLRRARDFSENVVASVTVPLTVLDAGLRVRMASLSFYEHFQVAPEATVGRLIYDLGNRQWDIPALRTLLEDLLPRDQIIQNYEARHTFEALGPRIMLLNARRLEHASGDEPLIILSIEDITERAAAAEARGRLAAIVESSDNAIIGKNLDGIITSWNRGAERLFGYSPAEIVGQSVTVLFPPDRQHESADILGHIRRGEAVEHLDTVRRRKDGTLFNVSLTVSPIWDGEGKIIGASKIARDITARKGAEAALSESEERFRVMANAMSQLAWMARADGHIFWYNQRWYEYTGTTPEAMEGWGWQSVHDPMELPSVLAKWKAAIASGEPFEMTFPLLGADGVYRLFLTRSVPVKSPDGAVMQWFGTNTDVDELKRVEAALRMSEQRFRTAVSTVSSLIWTNNAEGRMEGDQPGWENFTGQTREEYQGYGWAKAVHPEDAQSTLDAWEQSVAEKRMFISEHRLRRADGEWRLCSVRAVPILDDEGVLLEWVGVHNDITERTRNEEILRASEERAHALITASSDVVYRMNADWSEMAPLDGRNFISDALKPSRTWLDDNLFPEDQPQVLAAIEKAIRTKSIFALEHRVRRVDGTEGWTISKAVPILDARGEITEWFGAASDVTERHQAEEALRVSEGFKLSIIKSSPDCIKVLDQEGNLLSLEAGHDLLGITDVAPFIGTSWIGFWVDPKDRAAATAAIATAVAGGTGTFVGFFRNLRGEDKWWDVAVTSIYNAIGQTRHLLAVSRDVTERRALETALVARAEELAQADRSKDEFLAMLAHELRNPLAPLRNAAEMLKTDDVNAEDRTQAQRVITRQIENMSRMIDDLLDVSRITTGKIELRKKPVALEAVLTAAASLVRSTCAAYKQHLAVSLPKESVYLNADATRLEQIFGNLLGNACKYSGNGCHISISAERVRDAKSPEVVVTVRDDGAGIDQELLPRIFDLFVQASRTLDRAHGGLGIGLTLVRRLVELHGGSIEAHSNGHGHGAEFIVHLPILTEAPPPEPIPASPSAQPTSGPKRRILIVDDNTDAARSLAALQKRRGHETRTAFTGPEAVAMASEYLPDVVLLDIGLPGMDGFEVARRIRAMPGLSGTLLIAMSGYGRDEDRAEAKCAGFDEYMVKPVDLDTLRDWLQNGSRS